jgi:hypothetical protein
MTSVPATQPTESVAEKFKRLAAVWREAAPMHPRQPVRYDHPAYQEIVAMGPAVVPFLLSDLAQNHRHWFWALHLITGADPVLPTEREDPFAMTDPWLRWGRVAASQVDAQTAVVVDEVSLDLISIGGAAAESEYPHSMWPALSVPVTRSAAGVSSSVLTVKVDGTVRSSRGSTAGRADRRRACVDRSAEATFDRVFRLRGEGK